MHEDHRAMILLDLLVASNKWTTWAFSNPYKLGLNLVKLQQSGDPIFEFVNNIFHSERVEKVLYGKKIILILKSYEN